MATPRQPARPQSECSGSTSVAGARGGKPRANCRARDGHCRGRTKRPCAGLWTRICGAVLLALLCGSALLAADAPSPAAGMIKLLDSGRLPAERVPAIVDMIGKRGNTDDLAYLLARAAKSDGFAAPVRLQVLGILADAATTRNLKPAGDLAPLAALVAPDQDALLRLAALRLAGQWKVAALAAPLGKLALDEQTPPAIREAALRALGHIGGADSRAVLEQLSAAGPPPAIRYLAAAGLTSIDLEAGAPRAAQVLAAGSEADDPAPLLESILNQKGAAERLAAAVPDANLPPDAAKAAVRYLYSVGRAEGPLIAALSAAAGMSADTKPPSKEEVDRLVAEVAVKGDAARGELVFRRAAVSCFKCHALSGAGGSVGPDLSAVGATSPVDYVVNSILQPDLAVKEAYQQAIVQTGDGQVFQGILVEEGTDLLVLKDADGHLIKISRDEEDVIKRGGSLMPKGLVNLMTQGDFLDLVRFVSELGKPGAFNIRSTPTVQRWRFLKPVPPALLEGTPDIAAVKAQLLENPVSEWSPAYAKVAGELPLAEIVALCGSKVLYLQAVVDVTEAGPVGVKLNSTEGLHFWLDDVPHEAAESTVSTLERGQHKLTFRIDTASRGAAGLRVELFRPEGSPAAFTVLGGP